MSLLMESSVNHFLRICGTEASGTHARPWSPFRLIPTAQGVPYHSTVPNRSLEIMEINKNQPNENKQRVFIPSLLLAKESVTVTCILAETQMQRSGKVSSWEGGRLHACPDGRLLAETGGGLTGSEASLCDFGFGFLWLVS